MIKLGSKVKIRKVSPYYNSSEGNPTTVGIIIKESPLSVRWDNGICNTYAPRDLEPAKCDNIIVGSTGYVTEIEGVGYYTSFKDLDTLNIDHIAYKEWVEHRLHTEEIIDD